MRKYFGQIALMIVMVPLIMWGATKIQHAAIVSSTLDSSPVGSVTPSSGAFTSLSASGLAGSGTRCAHVNASGLFSAATADCATAYPNTIASGYQILPSGLIMEWGLADSSSSTYSLSFPLTFPTAVLSITFGTGNYDTNASRNVCYLQSPAPTTSGGTVKTDSSTVHCFWTAIGY